MSPLIGYGNIKGVWEISFKSGIEKPEVQTQSSAFKNSKIDSGNHMYHTHHKKRDGFHRTEMHSENDTQSIDEYDKRPVQVVSALTESRDITMRPVQVVSALIEISGIPQEWRASQRCIKSISCCKLDAFACEACKAWGGARICTPTCIAMTEHVIINDHFGSSDQIAQRKRTSQLFPSFT